MSLKKEIDALYTYMINTEELTAESLFKFAWDNLNTIKKSQVQKVDVFDYFIDIQYLWFNNGYFLKYENNTDISFGNSLANSWLYLANISEPGKGIKIYHTESYNDDTESKATSERQDVYNYLEASKNEIDKNNFIAFMKFDAADPSSFSLLDEDLKRDPGVAAAVLNKIFEYSRKEFNLLDDHFNYAPGYMVDELNMPKNIEEIFIVTCLAKYDETGFNKLFGIKEYTKLMYQVLIEHNCLDYIKSTIEQFNDCSKNLISKNKIVTFFEDNENSIMIEEFFKDPEYLRQYNSYLERLKEFNELTESLKNRIDERNIIDKNIRHCQKSIKGLKIFNLDRILIKKDIKKLISTRNIIQEDISKRVQLIRSEFDGEYLKNKEYICSFYGSYVIEMEKYNTEVRRSTRDKINEFLSNKLFKEGIPNSKQELLKIFEELEKKYLSNKEEIEVIMELLNITKISEYKAS